MVAASYIELTGSTQGAHFLGRVNITLQLGFEVEDCHSGGQRYIQSFFKFV
jgi:hypothetical protein